MVTIGAVGVAATNVGLEVFLPTGAFGRSSEAGTDVGALAALAGCLAGDSAGGDTFAFVLGAAFGVVLEGADFVVELFDVTCGGAFESFEDDGLGAAFFATLGVAFAFAPFAMAFVPFAGGFGVALAFTGAFDGFAALEGFAFAAGFAFVATFDFAAGFAFTTALPLAAGLAGALFLAPLLAGVTFVDFPLTLVLVAVLALFAVANLISSGVFLLFSLPPVAGSGISKTRKSTETIGQKQRIIRELQLLEK